MTTGYPLGQLSVAFRTARTHEDDATRRRADERAQRWVQAITGMLDGTVRVGSRTPVADLPAWVTLEVLRGGFATGTALAEGPLEPDESALAERLGLPATRLALFGFHLTDAGVAELQAVLDSGRFRVDRPEDAALLVVAWLLRAGDRVAALDLVETLAPLAHRLRFTPRATDGATTPPDHVRRCSITDARHVLNQRTVPAPITAQREALMVWNPFADRVLALWWPRHRAGVIDTDVDAAWRSEAQAVLATYDELAVTHRLCTKHRDPKQNLAVMLTAVRELLDGQLLPRRAGLLAAVLRAMVAKRGEPGSTPLARLRADQQLIAEVPDHAVLAALAADRLPGGDPDAGLADPAAYSHPVTAGESSGRLVAPAGTPMPPVVARTLARTRSAPVETLLDEGIVPSAEVLADVVPGITATVVAASYPDRSLARLMAAHYRAFRNRRSLLLTDLSAQVRLAELPWVRAVSPYRDATTDEAVAATSRVGALYLDHFPATIMPNPLVTELDELLTSAGHDIPLTGELAADIFQGRFSSGFAASASLAASLLAGSLYADYYGLDDPEPSAARPTTTASRRWWSRPRSTSVADAADAFGLRCVRRAGGERRVGRSVAGNGMIIEQAQVLTTHNLAALVSVGVRPQRPWVELATSALDTMAVSLQRAETQDRPLSKVKDAAYALRQAVFFLSMVPRAEAQAAVAGWAPATVPTALPTIVGGLAHVASGGRFDADGRCADGARLLGWTVDRPWVLPVAAPPADAVGLAR